MRCSQQPLTLQPIPFAWGAKGNKFFAVRNRSASNIIYVQFGQNPGATPDAWQVLAGETFIMDPSAPEDTIWLWSDLAGISNVVMMG